ncbi:TPA: hypothetical protein ACPJ0Z_003308 [Vibrio diabolicus]
MESHLEWCPVLMVQITSEDKCLPDSYGLHIIEIKVNFNHTF